MARKRTQKKSARVKSKSLKSYYGNFSPILIVVIVVAVAVIAGAGYFLFGRGDSSLGSKFGSKGSGMMMKKVTEDDFAYIEDELLRKHYASQANQTEFKVETQSSGMGGTATSWYVLEGENFKYRMQQTGEGMQSDMIVIGDTTYIKDFSDNKWWKQKSEPTAEEDQIEEQIEEYKIDPAEEQTQFAQMQYKNLGEEACGELMCHKYEETDPVMTDGGTRIFWFDTKEYLLRKEESGYGEFSSTSIYSYDDISVDEPSPTKDVPEGRSIYEYMGGGIPQGEGMPSQDEIDAMMKQYQESGDIEFPTSEEVNFDSGEY